MAHKPPADRTQLRRQAESHLSRIITHSVPSLAPENVEALVQELRVHQIELELQCQELLKAQAEVEESRNRYRELYESIPVGYATIDNSGKIYDVNPAGALLLGVERAARSLNNFFYFFRAGDGDEEILFCRKVLAEQEAGICEANMKKMDGSGFAASLQAVPVLVGEGKGERLRLAFHDISRRKKAEELLRQHEVELQDLMGKLFAAQEEERRRIACELHDDHCQRIAALILEAGSLERLFAKTVPSIVPRMKSLTEKLSEILDDFRHLTHELHPRHLDTVSLASSMRAHIKEIEDYSNFHIDFQEHDVPVHLPMPVVICLYRLLQESLGNIRKHANASHVTVRLSGSTDKMELLVADDGTGFDFGRPEERKKGLGLTSMQERVRPLHGRVSIDSKPSKGTTVTVTIPVPCV